MSMSQYDVILVSSFGQLDPLSTELAKSSLKVLHLDVTEKLGSWPLEDREGPFGSFQKETPSGSWGEILNHGDLEIPLEEGLVVWTDLGPVSLRGPLSSHQLQKRGWQLENQSSKSQEGFQQQIIPWMARSLQSTRYLTWSPEKLEGSKVPLSNPMSVRHPTRQGLEKRKSYMTSAEVTYWSDVEILDAVRFGLETVSGLEVKGPVNGVIKSHALVWGLTSLETDHLSFRVREKIFGTDVRRPLWAWVRFRFQITPLNDTARWPQSLVLIPDDGTAPWTHADLMVLNRTALPDQFDVWVRIPDSKRFHQNYVQLIREEIESALKQKLPTLQIQLIHEPQEASYTSKELGPRPFSQYAEDVRARNFHSKNLYFDGPEVWEHFSYDSITQNQKRIYEHVMGEWRKRMNREAARET